MDYADSDAGVVEAGGAIELLKLNLVSGRQYSIPERVVEAVGAIELLKLHNSMSTLGMIESCRGR